MTIYYDSQNELHCQSPLAEELREIFDSVPFQKLVKTLRAYRWTGRPGYNPETMLKAVLVGYYKSIGTLAELARYLEDHREIASVCGFRDYEPTPSRSTLSRFISRLTKHQDLLDECLKIMADGFKELLPDFGKVVAIDCTSVPSYSNPDNEPLSDKQAGWIVREGSERKQWEFGYRLHLIVDANWELPIIKEVTLAEDNEKKATIPLLHKAKESLSWFRPDAVVADKAYDKYDHYEAIVKDFDAEPIIKHAKHSEYELTGLPAAPMCPGGLPMIYRSWDAKKGLQYECPEKAGRAICPLALGCTIKTTWIKPVKDYRQFGYCIKRGSEEWQELYRKRVAAERCNSRLKEMRRLSKHQFRGFERISVHATLAILAMMAVALSKARGGQLGEIRACARKIA
ncbi:transposase [Dehalococcoidales bacterium]|nr:transposase [Dehalococcoidales bacterium]